MAKSDKELAVDLAVAVINTIPHVWANSTGTKQPISSEQIKDILTGCFNAVQSLPNSDPNK